MNLRLMMGADAGCMAVEERAASCFNAVEGVVLAVRSSSGTVLAMVPFLPDFGLDLHFLSSFSNTSLLATLSWIQHWSIYC